MGDDRGSTAATATAANNMIFYRMQETFGIDKSVFHCRSLRPYTARYFFYHHMCSRARTTQTIRKYDNCEPVLPIYYIPAVNISDWWIDDLLDCLNARSLCTAIHPKTSTKYSKFRAHTHTDEFQSASERRCFAAMEKRYTCREIRDERWQKGKQGPPTFT